ncbi:MAG: hypothetical protein ACLFVQ_11985 [Chitinispirillaceae bacterium]
MLIDILGALSGKLLQQKRNGFIKVVEHSVCTVLHRSTLRGNEKAEAGRLIPASGGIHELA